MNWDAFTPYSALIGGILIGISTGLVLVLNGRIAGISGVVARALRPALDDGLWRGWFVVGLAAGGALTLALYPASAQLDFSRSGGLIGAGVAGLLVGLGTRLGGGCTSGHGVCGISRGSPGGLVATLTFMAVAGVVVFVRAHVLGGGS